MIRRRASENYYVTIAVTVSAGVSGTVPLNFSTQSKHPFIVDFGDGSTPEIYIKNAAVSHTYAVSSEAKTYIITVIGYIAIVNNNLANNAGNYTITAVDVSQCPMLERLSLMNIGTKKVVLTALDISHNPKLTTLQCSYNQLTALDISHNPNLTTLQCSYNQLTALDISNNPNLTTLQCSYNQLTALDISNNPNLTTLQCSYNQLTALDISHNPNLTTLQCYSNQLTALDISHNPNLTTLWCYDNPVLTTITGLDGNTNTWDKLMLGNLPLTGNYDLTGISLSNNRSHIIVSTSGSIKVNNYINTDYIYSGRYVNISPQAFWIDCGSFEIYFAGETNPITSKIAYYQKIVQIVTNNNLQDYPQLCKIVTPVFGIEETRDNYATHKTLLCDSGLASSWKNDNLPVGTVTPYSHIAWIPSYQIKLGNSKGSVTHNISVTYSNDATFYIAPFFTGYYEWDSRQRVICANGSLTGSNVSNLVITDNGDNTLTATFTIIVTSAVADWWYLYLFENKYDAAYTTKITSFSITE